MGKDSICNLLAECRHTAPAVLERHTWCTSCGAIRINATWHRPSLVEGLRSFDTTEREDLEIAARMGKRPISER